MKKNELYYNFETQSAFRIKNIWMDVATVLPVKDNGRAKMGQCTKQVPLLELLTAYSKNKLLKIYSGKRMMIEVRNAKQLFNIQ